SEGEFWEKLKKFAKKMGIKVVYLALLLYYVLTCDTVSREDKLKILGALGYLILPIDLIPDSIPVLGFSDDLAALLWAYHSVQANVNEQIEQKAKSKLHEWFGEFDEEELKSIL
ncbi:MAG: DUF1232 domain-containing protein, partial [Bacteroidaceae bacterium]|nr:DUF1232 domain-containing protein [Bacteroidaceae bacterium]